MANANAELAQIFAQMADVHEILGTDRFRVNAFRRASRAFADLTEDTGAIGPDVKKLTAIDGVGKGTAQRAAEYLETGGIAEHAELVAQIPEGLMDLLDIPGLGPKTIALLWREGGVESLDDLKAKLDDDELAALPGLGGRKLENLRKSIAFAETTSERISIGIAMPIAEWFVQQIEKLDAVRQTTFAGSLRRGRETIGDLDLIVAADPDDAAEISAAFTALPPVTEVLVQGATKSSVRTTDGIQVDLRIVDPSSYGAALMYFTGSKEHNVAMRGRAIARDARLNEYGLWMDEQRLAGATEQEVFEALGLSWIDPALREDRDELALAEAGPMPALVEIGDIRSELHAHTTASDGRWSIEQLAETAAERGFHTIAVTDHSRSQGQANGLNEERLAAHMIEVREAARRLEGRIRVLAGTEVDILADGRLDYADALLAELDIVVASVHSALGQDPSKATARIVRAIENPHVDIIGHLTGRLILRREGLAPDVAAVTAAAADTDTVLEINANRHRLDLRDAHARAALEAGVKLAINTDAHGAPDLDELRYGVLTARRAGAKAEDVVNCWTGEKLMEWLNRS